MKKLKIFNFRIGESSPKFIFLFLIFLILFLELTIMIAFEQLDYNNHLIAALIDAAVLIIIITPFLFFFTYRPNLNFIREFKTMAQTLKESEKKYREIVENSPDAIIVHEEGKIVIINNESIRLLGLKSSSDLLGKMVIQFVHPDYRAMASERMKIAAIEGTNLPINEEKFIRPDGSVLDVEVKSTAIRYENKPAVQLIIRDITERKQAKEVQQVIYEITSSVATTNNLPELLKLIHQSLGKVLYADNIFVALFDQNSKLFSFPYWVDQFDHPIPEPDDMQKSLSSYVFRTGKSFLFTPELFQSLLEQNEVKRVGSPSPSWVGIPLSTPSGTLGVLVLQNYEKENVYSEHDVQFLNSVGTQISNAIARKKAEEDLRNERLLLRTVIDNIPDSIYSKDIDGRKTLANPTELLYSGLQTEAEIIGKTDFDLYPKELAEGFYADDQQVLQTGHPVINREEFVKDTNDQKHWLLTSKLPIKDEAGKITGLVGIGRDITKRRQAEEELRESEIKLNVILQSTADGILAIDGNGKVIKTNNRFAELWRIPQALIDSGDDQALIGFVLEQLENPGEFIAKVEKLYQSTDEDLDFLHFKDGRTFERFSAPMVMPDSTIGRVWSFRDITLARRAEEEMQRLNLAIDNSQEIVFMTDTKGIIRYMNPEFTKTYGYTAEEVVGKVTPRILNSGKYKKEDSKKIWDALLNKQSIPKTEYQNKCKDGKLIEVEGSANPILDDNGDVIGFLGIQRDITERKQAGEALRESEEKYRILIETMSDGVYRSTHDGRFTEVNDAMVKILGYDSKEALMSINIKSDLYFAEEERESAALEEKLEEMAVFRLRKKDGSEIWVEDHGKHVLDDHGEILYHEGSLRDVTDRKQAEDSLRESQEKFKSAFQYSAIGMALISLEGKWTKVNVRICEILGFSDEELMNLTFQDITHPDDLAADLKFVSQLLSGEIETYSMEKRYFHKHGNIVWVLLAVSLVRDKAGTPLYFISQIEDITERKKAENEIREANEQLVKINNEKDKFFSIIAHDLRAPFSGFLGLTQVMAEDLPNLTMKEAQEFAGSMRNSAVNLSRLLENLLQWSRLQQEGIHFTPESLNLKSIVDESIVTIIEPAKNKGIRIDSNIPENLNVIADQNLIQIVIRNLLSNALKFTKEGGVISISAKRRDEEQCEISILDTGIGMNSEIKARLFKLGEVTSRKGTNNEPSTGLGLILCKEFIEKQGGEIWAESEEGKGSAFYFTLPSQNEIEVMGTKNIISTIPGKEAPD